MAVPQFVVNAYRFDPYKNFKFRVRWDGKVVAGVSKVSALKQSTEPVTHREGGDPSSSRVTPSVWKFEPITLERGVTHDPEFENWAKKVWNVEGDAMISLKDFRKDIIIELLNEQGAVAKAYKIHRCWVSDYQAIPELDANAHAVAIEHLVLQNEGWERDMEVPEPTQT
ncbi:phage tail protein [Flavihumibacter fluvii]|uniref:phage tail protein n=1 Tax=Flavihumibacter fluvii TaxID=2838157 RepID=UPI001BDE2637|nr:phage tail protein [Flavihumibacter fluvii]ULQ53227.1 phage tail protein [Flavihumibacter fluvii]